MKCLSKAQPRVNILRIPTKQPHIAPKFVAKVGESPKNIGGIIVAENILESKKSESTD